MWSREVLERRRRAFEDHHRADVHVRVRALLGEERGVDRGQAIPMGLGHGALYSVRSTVVARPARIEITSRAVTTGS